jgi:uncharacterized protein (TIGR02996 family)
MPKPIVKAPKVTAPTPTAAPAPAPAQDWKEMDREAKRKALGDVVRYVNDDELDEIQHKHVQSLASLMHTMPPPEEWAAAARAGGSKRGWYEDASKAIFHLFGPKDAPRFIGLLAATSPRASPFVNIRKALGVWRWYKKRVLTSGHATTGSEPSQAEVEAWLTQERSKGRENTPEQARLRVGFQGLRKASEAGEVMGKQGIIRTHDRAMARALTADPDELLSNNYASLFDSPKIDTFRRNLLTALGDAYKTASTNDVWVANLGDTDAKKLHTAHYYIAHTARLRQAVELLNSELAPGEKPWTPAEVQETVWSFQRSLARRVGRSKRGGQKGLTAREALRTLTHGEIADTPDFLELLVHDPELQRVTADLGPEFARRLEEVRKAYESSPKRITPKAGEVAAKGSLGVLDPAARRAAKAYRPFIRKTFNQRKGTVKRYAAKVFASGNTDEGLNLPQAAQRLSSANQGSLKAVARELWHTLGVKHYTLHDAIGDWSDGAEPSLVHSVDEPLDEPAADYAAAWFGLMSNQKAVLRFTEHPEGPDSLYQFHLPTASLDEARNTLTQYGIPYRTLVPGKARTTVLVYDQGRQLRDHVSTLSGDLGAEIRESTGRGKFLGDGSDQPTRTAARAAYRRVIDSYERGGTPAGSGQVRPDGGAQVPAPAGTGPVRQSRTGRRVRYARDTGSEHQPFLDAVGESVGRLEAGPSKVYSDWLDEQGHPGGEHIRESLKQGYWPHNAGGYDLPHGRWSFRLVRDGSKLALMGYVGHQDRTQSYSWRRDLPDPEWVAKHLQADHPDYDVSPVLATHLRTKGAVYKPDGPVKMSRSGRRLRYARSEADKFHAAVVENPSDPNAVKVYADWLDERGHPLGQLLHRVGRAKRLAVTSPPLGWSDGLHSYDEAETKKPGVHRLRVFFNHPKDRSAYTWWSVPASMDEITALRQKQIESPEQYSRSGPGGTTAAFTPSQPVTGPEEDALEMPSPASQLRANADGLVAKNFPQRPTPPTPPGTTVKDWETQPPPVPSPTPRGRYPRQYAAAQAPAGGAVARGLTYRGGKFLPKDALYPPKPIEPIKPVSPEVEEYRNMRAGVSQPFTPSDEVAQLEAEVKKMGGQGQASVSDRGRMLLRKLGSLKSAQVAAQQPAPPLMPQKPRTLPVTGRKF